MSPSSKSQHGGEGDPRRRRPADGGADRRAGPVLEELARWDDLAPDRLSRLAAHPIHGRRLERLQAVDAWLEARVRRFHPCPSAEELYHFGRGPGYEPLEPELRARIDLHLFECGECADLVGSLRASPPLPLDVSPPLDGPLPASDPRPHPDDPFAASGAGAQPAAPRPPSAADFESAREPRRGPSSGLGAHWPGGSGTPSGGQARPRPLPSARGWRPLLPLAAAAGVTWLLVVVQQDSLRPREAGEGSLPQAPLLRGDLGGPLFFPRDRVLAAPSTGGGRGTKHSRSSFAAAPLFEVETIPGASLYRVILRRHDGSAFDAGRDIEHIESQRTRLGGSRSLAPGHYTWEAWAIVDGLDRRMGARDFEVVEDQELWRELEALDDHAAIRRLHDVGYLTDARALAQQLPASAEREAYLRDLPGR